MFNTKIKYAVYIFIIAQLLDAILPSRAEQFQVNKHLINTHGKIGSTLTTSYDIYFTGRHEISCSTNSSTYTALNDGDTVEISTSKIFKKCLKIIKEGKVIESKSRINLILLMLGIIIIEVFSRARKNTSTSA